MAAAFEGNVAALSTTTQAQSTALQQCFTGDVQTMNATITTAVSYTPLDNHAQVVEVTVVSRDTTPVARGFVLVSMFRRTGATTTQLGVVSHVAEHGDVGTATWNATLDTSGTTIRVRVTGALATTIDWHVVARVTQTPNP